MIFIEAVEKREEMFSGFREFKEHIFKEQLENLEYGAAIIMAASHVPEINNAEEVEVIIDRERGIAFVDDHPSGNECNLTKKVVFIDFNNPRRKIQTRSASISKKSTTIGFPSAPI